MKNSSILLSIKPIYAHKIFTGEKKVELRRRLPKDLKKGDLVLVYISSPEKKIFGAFTVKKIITATLNELWHKVSKKACISQDNFFGYFHDSEIGHGIMIENYWTFPEPISLEDIKNHNDSFNIPQSYRYLKEDDYNLIEYEFGVAIKTV